MVFCIGFLERFLRPGNRHPGLPYMNADLALSDLGTWFNGRAVMDLPMLFVLEGPPAVGKSALAEVMASEGDSVLRVGGEALGDHQYPVPAGTATVIIDDADQGDQAALIETTDALLGKSVVLILFVQARHCIAPELLAIAGTGSITRNGVRLDQHRPIEQVTRESQANDPQFS